MAEEVLIDEHPALKNAIVLENIFQFVSLKCLKRCRLVSKAWQDATKKMWKLRASVRIYGNSKMFKFIEFLRSPETMPQEEMYQKIRLQDIKFFEPPPFELLWSLRGSQLKSLEISSCKFKSMYHFRKILYKHCPNLQHLKLCHNEVAEKMDLLVDGNGSVRESLPGEQLNLKSLTVDSNLNVMGRVPWLELLAHFPNVQVLRNEAQFGTIRGDKELYEAINMIRRHDNTKLKLKELYVLREEITTEHESFPASLLELLLDADLHLEKSSLSLNGDDNTVRVKKALGQQCASLTHLELDGRICEGTMNPADCLPPSGMKNLEMLSFEGRVFTNLEVFKFLPNLKKLTISWPSSCNVVAATDMERMPNVILENCTELDVENELSLNELEKLIALMPNIRTLTMALDNETFPRVCERWTNLESLEIHDYAAELDDTGFTGFDAEIVNQVNECQGQYLPDDSTSRKPNITNLKYLRKLIFRCINDSQDLDREQPVFHFGFCTALQGIERLPNLQQFRFMEYGDLLDIENRVLRNLWRDLLQKYPFKK